MPYLAAITSGTVTSFDNMTELAVASAQTASEKVAFWTIVPRARSNTVELNSSYVMPVMPSATAMIGVRVGLGVGTGVSCAVVGTGVGSDVGTAVGTVVGNDNGRGVGSDDGTAVGTGVGDSTQTLLIHANDEQSLLSVHARPTLQEGQSSPPQSTSVSEQSVAPFVQISNVGMGVGTVVGSGVGAGSGIGDGTGIGTVVGAAIGAGSGTDIGARVGTTVGAGIGTDVGAGNGTDDGETTQVLSMHASEWQSSSIVQN